MATRYRCVQGHEWQDEFGGVSNPDGEAPCPACGLPSFTCLPPDDSHAATELFPAAPVAIPAPTTILPVGRVSAPATGLRAALAERPLAPTPSPETDDADPVSPSQRMKRSRQGGQDTLPNGAATKSYPNIPGYEILGELGRGGMGVVYKARQVRLNRLVAIKMIISGSNADDRERARFLTEAEAIARLQHPNIVQIFEVNEYQGSPWFSLEFVDGGSLADRLKGEPLAVTESARLLELLARAIHFAHEHGVVHRDLKPANVLLHREEAAARSKASTDSAEQRKPSDPSLVSPRVVPKVTDFGLAKTLDQDLHHTRSGMVVGTPSYMAPEQATHGSGVGPSTDIFALGVILYQLVTGRLPFVGETAMEIMIKVTQEEPVPPTRFQPRLARDLETIILKCLEKEQVRRYLTAGDLAEDLRRFLNHEPILARPVRPLERSVRWVKRHPALATFAAVGTVALLGFLGTFGVVAHAEQSRRSALRNEVATALRRAREKADARSWEAIPALLEESRKRVREDRGLTDLAGPVEELASQAAAQLQAQNTYTKFARERTEALFHAAQASGSPTALQLEATRARLQSALAVVGASASTLPPLNQPFTAEAKAEIQRGCYELLLLLADAVATKPSDRAAANPQRGKDALVILDTAAGLGFRTKAYHLRRARLSDEAGQPAEAAAERKRAAALQPRDDLDYYLVGSEHYRLNELDQAERAFDAALRFKPDHFWALYYLALCHIRQGQLIAARDNLTACLAQQPGVVSIYLLRGFVQGQLGRNEEAEADFTSANDLLATTQDSAARYALLNNRAVTRLGQKNKEKEALEDLDRAIKERPEWYQAYVTLSQVHLQRERPKEALAALDQAIARASALQKKKQLDAATLTLLYQLRYRIHMKASNSAAALVDLETAIGLQGLDARSQARALRDRGHMYLRNNQLDKALATYDRAVALAPNEPELQRWRGDVHLRRQDYDEALKAFDRYVELGGKPEGGVFRGRALAMMQLGQNDRAALAFTQALELAPQNVQLRVLRGRVYLALKAWEPAARDFDQALKATPSAEARQGRALAYLQLGKPREALADALEVGKLAAGDGRQLFGAACLLAQAAGQIDSGSTAEATRRERARHQDRALALLERSLEARPVDERAAFWREMVLPEPSLRPLRARPGFGSLDRRYGSAREKP